MLVDDDKIGFSFHSDVFLSLQRHMKKNKLLISYAF